MVLNKAKMHLGGDFQKALSMCFCLFHFFFPCLLFSLGQNFSPSPMEQLSRTVALSWDSLPSGYK